MKNNTVLFFLVMVVMILPSCEDFEEKDLSKEQVMLIAPSDNLITAKTRLTFWWDSLETVEIYNLRIVSKSFIQIEDIVLDTTVVGTKVSKILKAGEFEWKVTAIGKSSVAHSDTFGLVITPDEVKKSL